MRHLRTVTLSLLCATAFIAAKIGMSNFDGREKNILSAAASPVCERSINRRSRRTLPHTMKWAGQVSTRRGSWTTPNCGPNGGGCLGSKPAVEAEPTFELYEHDKSDTTLTVNWGSFRSVDFYELQFKGPEGDWKSVANSTSTFVRKKNLAPETEYSFRMRYQKNGNMTDFTEAFCLKTLSTKEVSTRMAGPSGEAVDGTQVRIFWDRPPKTTKFEIQIKEENGGIWKTMTTDYMQSSARKRDLKSGTGYFFRFRGWNRETETWGSFSEPSEVIRTMSLNPVMRELFGDTLQNAAGEKIPIDSLAGKLVGVYFSAHWCPPCRQFTPMLADFYRRAKEAKKNFEIVFVSSDQDGLGFRSYLSEMPWVAVPFRNFMKRQKLGQRYEVRGIPHLKILSPKGEILCNDGVRESLSIDRLTTWERQCKEEY